MTAASSNVAAGRHLAVVAAVVGTDEDPQGLARQERLLEEAGVALASSNARAARLAAAIVGVARASQSRAALDEVAVP